ncbi:hypothetical protein ['Paenibacillus yunnanensis' Narsing Rao et al. 2020]|uniref:hypothetical protein n=1 Tax=Paenibacillus tengchongensis TaxID=2608684 RepID=UPI001651C9F1|nr:hypothetical protein [Paenibacillus tengchongensis]
MKKQAWMILSVCGTLAVYGFVWSNNESYEVQKKSAGVAHATTEDGQKLKELAGKAGEL